MFKRFKIAEKNASNAAIEVERINARIDKHVEEERQLLARIEAVIGYILVDAVCPICGTRMQYAVKVSRGGFFSLLCEEHRLICPNDSYEVKGNSLIQCMEKLKNAKKETNA